MNELELLARAVAGRDIALERTRQGVHADGTTIFVGADVEAGSDDAWRAVVAQAALLASGSLEKERMRRLSRSPSGSARRYLGLEVVRACAELATVLPGRFQRDVTPYAARVGVTASADESLRRALGGSQLDDPPAWFGQLHPLQVLKASGSAGGQPASDSELAEALRTAMEAADSPDDDDDSGDGERSRIMELLSSPLKNPLGSALQRMLGAQRSAGDGAGGAEITVVEPRVGVPSGSVRALRLRPPPLVDVGGQITRGASYPEWDCRRARYRDSWCTAGEFDPPPAAAANLPLVPAEPRLMRELARLGLTWRPHAGEPLGDELDLTALVDHRARVAAGTSGDPAVYRAERRTAQELGALVLLDATGSTAERVEGRSMFDEQRLLAHGLTTALDRIGVRVATYAFYSRGRGNVRFLRCKSFEERWGLLAQRRLAAVTPSGFTRLGAAVRHATHLLDTQAGTQRRLLVVVGDGIPYDDGYEGRYALEDSRRAVDEARTRAVGCVGVSTRPTTDGDAIWPPDAHRVTPTPADLADEARALFDGALRRADRGSARQAV